MIKTYTRNSDSLQSEAVENSEHAEDLGEEEQGFYSSIRKGLNQIELSPNQTSIDNILNYSKLHVKS